MTRRAQLPSPRHVLCCTVYRKYVKKENPVVNSTDPNSRSGLYRWSAVSRTDRYRRRCGDEGHPTVDETNPLPKLIDPITLEPVVTPAISPYGHVMGLATWKVESHNLSSKMFSNPAILWCRVCHLESAVCTSAYKLACTLAHNTVNLPPGW